MNGTQKTGVGLAAGATPLWVLYLVAVSSTGPQDGANIGAGFAWVGFLVLQAGDLASSGVVLAVLVVGLLGLTTAVVRTVQVGRRAA